MTKILIIGGMGPQASVHLHKRINEVTAQLGASEANQFPEIVHISVPVEDFISDGDKIANAVQRLNRSLRYCLWRAFHPYSYSV